MRIKGKANRGDIMVGAYYRPLDQEEEVDETFYRQLQVASRSQALVPKKLVKGLEHMSCEE